MPKEVALIALWLGRNKKQPVNVANEQKEANSREPIRKVAHGKIENT